MPIATDLGNTSPPRRNPSAANWTPSGFANADWLPVSRQVCFRRDVTLPSTNWHPIPTEVVNDYFAAGILDCQAPALSYREISYRSQYRRGGFDRREHWYPHVGSRFNSTTSRSRSGWPPWCPIPGEVIDRYV